MKQPEKQHQTTQSLFQTSHLLIAFSSVVTAKNYQQPLGTIPEFSLKHLQENIKTHTWNNGNSGSPGSTHAFACSACRLRWGALEGPEQRSNSTAETQWDLGSAVVQGPGGRWSWDMLGPGIPPMNTFYGRFKVGCIEMFSFVWGVGRVWSEVTYFNWPKRPKWY